LESRVSLLLLYAKDGEFSTGKSVFANFPRVNDEKGGIKLAFVTVPKDLTKVKNKLIFNLTKRQIICFGIAAAVGLPFYFLTRGLLGTSGAATGMVMLMLPGFLFAMYEKDGLPLEKVLGNILRTKYLRPGTRRFAMTNLYESNIPTANMKHNHQKGRRHESKKKR